VYGITTKCARGKREDGNISMLSSAYRFRVDIVYIRPSLRNHEQHRHSDRPTLRFGDLCINCEAKLETGAEVSYFKEPSAKLSTFTIDTGVKKRLETLTRVLTAYRHEVVLELVGLKLQAVVYSPEGYEQES
jgi:hypothetical protein